jgi:hypothetical protein
MKKKQPLSDLDADIRDHLDRETQDNIERGMTPEEARYAALRKFGNTALIREETRAVWIPIWLDQFRQDFRYGFRTLRREPGYTTAVIALMALGIAATTTLVSVTSGVLLKPLPWPQAERLVRLEERREGRSGRVPWTISNASYLAFRESLSSTVEEIGGWGSVQSTFRGVGDPERIRVARITPNVFQL